MSDYYFIGKNDLEQGIRLCLNKVKNTLDDVEILCTSGGSEVTGVALYSIALEEFGKMLLLKSALDSDPEENGYYKISKSIFGRSKSHQEKLSASIKSLPEVCTAYRRFEGREYLKTLALIFKKNSRSTRKKLRVYRDSPNVKIIFTLAHNFEIRKNLLYLDWNDEEKNWNPTLIKDGNFEYNYVRDELDEYDESDISVESQLDRIEGYVQGELEDKDMKVDDVNDTNVLMLQYPESLLYAVRFFKKYINNELKI